MRKTKVPFNDMDGHLSIFSLSKTGVLFSSFDGDILGVNQAMRTMLGYSSKEMIGRKAWFADHDKDVYATQNLYKLFKNSSLESINKQKKCIDKSGASVFVDESISLVVNKDSEQQYLMALYSYSTDGNDKEQSKIGINEYLQEAIESTTAFITVLDLVGRVKYANKVAEGVSIEKFIGSKIYDWLEEDISEKIRSNIDKVLEEKSNSYYETEYTDPTGGYHYFNNDMAPIYKNNKIIAVSIVTYESTDLKELQYKLNRSKDVVGLSLQAAEMGVWEWDEAKKELIWDENLCKILGIDNVGHKASFESFKNMLCKDDTKKIIQENKLAFENKSKYEGEFRIHRLNDKKLCWISFKSKFTLDEEGDIIRLLGIAWDSTKSKEIEIERQRATELERQNVELQQFAYLASHDLKSPLRTIINFSGLLIKRYSKDLDETANSFLGHIQSSAVRMEVQIKDLLDYAMLGRNDKLKSIDCNDLLKDIIIDLDFIIKNSNCKILVEDLPVINGYKTEIALLFGNLITNAIKFKKVSSDPVINISYTKDDNYVEFIVKDNGIGIDKKYKEKIFVLFQRLHNSEEYEGTGIGLAHCKKTVELHGGKIWVESTKNEGSSFHFTIKT